jgi:hypothetical protein
MVISATNTDDYGRDMEHSANLIGGRAFAVRKRVMPVLGSILLTVMMVLIGPEAAVLLGQEAHSGQPAAFTIDDEAALWTVAIKPDKTQDFETVMTKLREALQKSPKPERQKQVAGWKLLKMDKPMPDGSIVYVHIIDPVVRGADYTILKILYDEFPDERQALYELYRGAFAKNLSLVSGAIVLDLSKTP